MNGAGSKGCERAAWPAGDLVAQSMEWTEKENWFSLGMHAHGEVEGDGGRSHTEKDSSPCFSLRWMSEEGEWAGKPRKE